MHFGLIRRYLVEPQDSEYEAIKQELCLNVEAIDYDMK